MASISFVYPMYLLFLLLIPLFIFIHFITLKATRSTALRFANFEAIAKIKSVDFFSKNLIILFLSILIVFVLVMALSGLTLHTIAEASKHSFVIALDTSESMGAKDMSPNRLEAAKQAAIDFVSATPFATKTGVISFSGNALIEQDLTDSKEMVKTAIRDIEISPVSGTDIYEAVITGTNLLKGEESGAIIILSDGQINVGSIAQSIEYANANNIIVHAIGMGTKEGGITLYGGISKIDEDSLKSLSYGTKGEFFKVTDGGELLDSFNKAIEKTQSKIKINLSNYLIMAAALLFSLEYFLISSRYKRLV